MYQTFEEFISWRITSTDENGNKIYATDMMGGWTDEEGMKVRYEEYLKNPFNLF